MISRLTASAIVFAVLATTALTFASETQAKRAASIDTARHAVVMLAPVVVIGHRSH